MLERLAQAFAQQEQALLQQRAFAAAASPRDAHAITVIKTELDVLRRGRTVRPEEARVLQGLEREVVRLARASVRIC